MVSAVLPIIGTPLVVSCDDMSVIKTWHIQDFKCLQTIKLAENMQVNQFLLTEFKLCLVSDRLDFMQIDDHDFIDSVNSKFD